MDQAEVCLETLRRAYSDLDPLDHKRRKSGRGPETGNLRRVEGPPPLWSDLYGRLGLPYI